MKYCKYCKFGNIFNGESGQSDLCGFTEIIIVNKFTDCYTEKIKKRMKEIRMGIVNFIKENGIIFG